jgi:predicted NBD/HSP70 family sugar kinase
VGEKALVTRARERGIISTTDGIGALHVAAHSSRPGARALFEEAGHLLGRTVAGLVNTIDPSLVVVLGEGVESWQHWSVGFAPSFRAGLIPRKRGTGVAVERWQDDRWAQGAACLVLATPFDEDGISGEQGRLVRARLLEATEAVTTT